MVIPPQAFSLLYIDPLLIDSWTKFQNSTVHLNWLGVISLVGNHIKRAEFDLWFLHCQQHRLECLSEVMELYQVPSRELDGWIAGHLQPSKEFQVNVHDAVNRICTFLKEKCSMEARVIKTVKVSLL